MKTEIAQGLRDPGRFGRPQLVRDVQHSSPVALEKILIPVDFSQSSRIAARAGVALARELRCGAHIVHVIGELQSLDVDEQKQQQFEQAVVARAHDSMRGLVADLLDLGVELTSAVVRGDVTRRLLDSANESSCGLIVVGSAGHGEDQPFFLGSIAVRLIREATCPVLVIRKRHAERLPAAGLFRRPLVAIDYSRFSQRSVEMASLLSSKDATIELYHVLFEPLFELFPTGEVDKIFTGVLESNRKKERVRLHAIGHAARIEQDVRPVIEIGRAAEVISEHVEANNIDLVVTGAHGRESSTGLLIGTVADRLLRASLAPVLFIPDRAVEEA